MIRAFETLGTSLADIWGDIKRGFFGFVNGMITGINAMISGIVGGIQTAVNLVIDGINALIAMGGEVAKAMVFHR